KKGPVRPAVAPQPAAQATQPTAAKPRRSTQSY
ncbi:MAG: ribonuclease HI, partial [Mesorhizobium sp.]